MAWMTSDLIADVRRRAMLPNTSTLGTTDADILVHADNVMASRLVPLVQSVNEEFYVQTVDVALVAGQSAYRMPARNSGAKLRDVTLLRGNVQLNLARIEPERLTEWTSNPTGTPVGFYLEAGTINLVPAPAGGGALRLRYFVRPGALVTSSAQYAPITAVTYGGANAVVLSVAGASAFVPSAGPTVDVIAARPPFEYLITNGPVTSTVTGGSVDRTITLSGPTSPAPNFSPNIAVGDYITQVDVSPVIQLPVELHSLLVQRVVCAIMETLNYRERWEMACRVAEEMEEQALRLISPRVDGAPRKMRGLLSGMRAGWR